MQTTQFLYRKERKFVRPELKYIAQLVEQLAFNRKVLGSNPNILKKYLQTLCKNLSKIIINF